MSSLTILRKAGINDKHGKAKNYQSDHQCHNETEGAPVDNTEQSNNDYEN